MDNYRCNECAFCRVIRGHQRGVMDCDPDEFYCEADEDEFFYTDWEYDEDDELIECPSYRDADYYWDD